MGKITYIKISDFPKVSYFIGRETKCVSFQLLYGLPCIVLPPQD